jgi:putative hydrolase of the HAD superfamily
MSLSVVPLPEQAVIVFDLDDTLYPERDYIRSGFCAVSQLVQSETGSDIQHRLAELFECDHPDPFEQVLLEYRIPLAKHSLITTYRSHLPRLALRQEVEQLLNELRARGHTMGLLTDGRSVTQRNKIRALHLDRWINDILISEEFGSEKPDERNYQYFERLFPGRRYVYIGDNLNKDFIAPNRLGWQTVCVRDSGHNLHPQDAPSVPKFALPQYWIEQLA